MRSRSLPVVALWIASVAVFLGVGAGAAVAPATINPVSLPSGTVGVSYSQTLSVNGHTPPYTVRVTHGSLPAGLSLSAQGSLSGSPTTAGTYAFTVSALTSDGTSVAVRDYGVTVAAGAGSAPTATTISPISLPSGTVGVAYSQTVSVSGPAPPYTVRVASGTLPSGLTLALSGALSGTPTTAGSWSFTISAFSSSGVVVASRSYTLAVVAATTNAASFFDDFTAGLGKWNREGVSSAFAVVPGWSGQGAGITAAATNSGGSQLASLWLNWPTARAQSGMDTWYRARVMFPTDYRATSGQWNWFMEWHIDDVTSAYAGTYSTSLGVFTDYPVTTNPGVNPRLAFRINGGSVSAPRQEIFTLPPNSLKLGSWYDIVAHFIWSPNATVGRAELWIDGQLIVSKSFPTLYTRPNGSSSYNYFGLYNYRLAANWASTIRFDSVGIGPTRASLP